MQDFLQFGCPSCGGTVQIKDYQNHYICDYCGNEIYIKSGSELEKTITQYAITKISETIIELNQEKKQLFQRFQDVNQKLMSARTGNTYKIFSIATLIIFVSISFIFYILPLINARSNLYPILGLLTHIYPGIQHVIIAIIVFSLICFIVSAILYISQPQIDYDELIEENEMLRQQINLVNAELTQKQNEIQNIKEIIRIM